MNSSLPADSNYPGTVASSATWQSASHAHNEDAMAAVPEAGLFVVADGMGGHADGDLASRSIVEILCHAVDGGSELAERMEQAEMAIQSINRALRREGEQRPKPVIIGSTVALLLIGEGYAACLWAGDSRIYLLRDGELYQLTRDHTLAAETQETSARAQNIITRAVGPRDLLELDRLVTPVTLGDTLLVCSDGLTKVMEPDEIGELMREPMTGLAERIVARAVVLGSRDDVTVVVVRICDADGTLEARLDS
jgi:serine/threonine protein phosphatase PrpC